ncbi:MAG: hypothetical protein ACUVXF_05960 [Desulfobaccales bacterium]
MTGKEAVPTALKEIILPACLKQETSELEATLALTNRRLDDLNAHLVDQSRRLSALRGELGGRFDAVREEVLNRLDAVGQKLGGPHQHPGG